jgi:hypothetical protein
MVKLDGPIHQKIMEILDAHLNTLAKQAGRGVIAWAMTTRSNDAIGFEGQRASDI